MGRLFPRLLSLGGWTRFCLLLLSVGLVGCQRGSDDDLGELRDAARAEGAAMCPWREPDSDLAAWFPGATRTETEVLILSGLRPELAARLGRPVTAEENALHLHRVLENGRQRGEVVVRRVKGESGAVELVVALSPDGSVLGIRVQRSREPDAVAVALGSSWLGSFRGRTARDPLQPGADLPAVPEAARVTAAAICDGVRSLLILRELGTGPGALRRPAPEASPGSHH